MREKDVENYLVTVVEAIGGLCWKWTGTMGAPDRVVVASGEVYFVEVKRPGGRLSAWQKKRHQQIRDAGGRVVVVWDKNDVDEFVSSLLEMV